MQCRLPRMQTMIKMPSIFSDATWEQIISACQSNSVPSTWAVGDSKTMTINGTDYQIDIIGKNHDTYTAGGTAPLTFQLHDCYGTSYRMNSSRTNEGGWADSEMRNKHLPAILALMPIEVQFGIREVNKLTSAGNYSSTINTTADKLFLLSEIEIFGSITYSKSGEGSQYGYYASSIYGETVKNQNGAACFWWERSPYKDDTERFCEVKNNGSAGYVRANESHMGVAFGFCF